MFGGSYNDDGAVVTMTMMVTIMMILMIMMKVKTVMMIMGLGEFYYRVHILLKRRTRLPRDQSPT